MLVLIFALLLSDHEVFITSVEEATEFYCERRNDGSVACRSGAVVIRSDGLRGFVAYVDSEEFCIKVRYEDGSESCEIPEDAIFQRSPSLYEEVHSLYHGSHTENVASVAQ